jgi:hypothetical protein
MTSLKDESRNGRPLLSIVDDDESVRESLPDLIKEFGFAAQAFSSAEEFLRSGSVDQSSLLILDIAMPGMTGPDKRMRRFVAACSNRAQPDFCSSHLVTQLCLRPSRPHFKSFEASPLEAVGGYNVCDARSRSGSEGITSLESHSHCFHCGR